MYSFSALSCTFSEFLLVISSVVRVASNIAVFYVFFNVDIQGGSKLNTPADNMQYLHNQWSDYKNSWSWLILTLLRIQRCPVYPLHLNYATTLPRKTITMKNCHFHYSACIEIKWNMEIWHFRLSQFIWRHVQSIQCPVSSSSRGISPRLRDIPVLAHAMSGFSIYRPRKLGLPMIPEIN